MSGLKLPRWLVALALLLVMPAAVLFVALRQPSADGWVERSRALVDEGDVDGAVAALDDALVRFPNDPLLYVERGQRILLLYEWDRALADFDRAIALAPAYADAYFFRGVLYASVPDPSARPTAAADFRHYLALAPDGIHAQEAARYLQQLTPPP